MKRVSEGGFQEGLALGVGPRGAVRSCQRVGRFNDYLTFYLSDKKKEARLEELLKKE